MMVKTDLVHQHARLILVAMTLVGFALRVWHLDLVPPGWRDDELINSLVISQKVLDGDLAVYYPDASGHEALYHALNAVMLGTFGPNAIGIRLLSAFLGTLAIPLTAVLGSRLIGRVTGLSAAAGMAFSFWSLMYSRIGLRHVLIPVLTLAAFIFFWRGLQEPGRPGRSGRVRRYFIAAAIFMGLGFYTYFASRGLPLILFAFCVLLWWQDRGPLRERWRPILMMFGIAGLMAIPLLVTLNQQPESEARIDELAVPLVEAMAGRFDSLWYHIQTTLSMFHSQGDPEWLYNIPGRPVFGLVGALFFWGGVALATRPLLRAVFGRSRSGSGGMANTPSRRFLPSAFLLTWWLAGISPAFISVPPASLGHTIVAQPAVFILAGLTAHILFDFFSKGSRNSGRLRLILALLPCLVLPVSVAWRDLPAYFQEWPGRGMVRFLYRADMHDIGDYLNQHPELTDFGVTSLLAGPWDRLALTMHLDRERAGTVRARWYNPERAILLRPGLGFTGFPRVPSAYAEYQVPPSGPAQVGGYQLTQAGLMLEESKMVCFRNGLCWLTAHFDRQTGRLELGWQAGHALDLPNVPLTSNPPPPGVYAGPRLLVFAHLLDTDGAFISGDDGLWVDPETVMPGDVFLQQHWFRSTNEEHPAVAVFGLYDPMTGERILTEDGRDHLELRLEE